MPDKSVLEKILNNTPIALVIIGIFLFLTGAAGGWPTLSLVVNDLGWQIALASTGVLVAGVGILQIFKSSKSESKPACKDYHIKITSIQPGQIIARGDIEITGTYKKFPNDKSVKVFVIDRRNQYWVQTRPIRKDDKSKIWHSQVLLGGSVDTHATIAIGIVGSAGDAMCEYYKRVGDVTGQRVGITMMTPDVAECDSVRIVKK